MTDSTRGTHRVNRARGGDCALSVPLRVNVHEREGKLERARCGTRRRRARGRAAGQKRAHARLIARRAMTAEGKV